MCLSQEGSEYSGSILIVQVTPHLGYMLPKHHEASLRVQGALPSVLTCSIILLRVSNSHLGVSIAQMEFYSYYLQMSWKW